MFFQVDISPTRKPKRISKIPVEPEEVPVLSLAPFTSVPKVCFDNVLLGSSVSKTLIIQNPTANDIMLCITKAPPEERCLSFSWVKRTICSHEEVTLELFWQALTEGGWKDTITFQDGRRLKKDVGVIFKAIKPKNTKIKRKKIVTCVSTKIKSPKKWFSPKRKSPLTKSSKPNNGRAILPDITNIPHIFIESPIDKPYLKSCKISNESTYVISNKENLEISGIENLNHANNVFEGSNKICCSSETENKIINENEAFEDSLEMNETFTPNFKSSKLDLVDKTPSSIEDKFKAIVFTPNLPNKFQPNFSSTSEKSCSNENNVSLRNLLPEKNLNMSNISSATYNIDKQSPELNEKLLNVSSDTCSKGNLSSETFVKGNISSSTYIKEGNSPEPSFSGHVFSPVPLEINNLKGEIGYTSEFNYRFETYRPKQCLEQIVEESYISFNASQLNKTDSRKRRSENCLKAVSPKRKLLEDASNYHVSLRNNESRRSFKAIKTLNLKEFIRKSNGSFVEEATAKTQSTKNQKQQALEYFPTQNPFILTATNSIDPFMSGTMYYDPRWVDEQIEGFKKWLNALLTPPEELDSNAEGSQMDIVKLWQDCKKREVLKAPTKEIVSSKYHTKGRLQSLRRNASDFFRSPKISGVLSKICMMIENEKLVIRNDKDVHLDLGLQAEISILFLSYNPLWLRIGLETVYNVAIPLHSNSDVVGLVMFLSENFFKDQYLLKKYKTVHSKKYAADIKKMILKKFFMLIFFLDKAKEIKLIQHDPCLFCKTAPFKESRDIILKFSRELLSSVGDITKVVRCTGYVLNHKQTYIHEFDYAVNNLGVDLRDGVRLTRVMEIILLKEGLTNGLRVPSISRLQKVHNMKIVFDALKKSGFSILYDIEPKDIVDGHKEKTLSFLWQIIYMFQAPRITKAVITIQMFWRSLKIIIKRRIIQKERFRREQAALTVQRWYKRMILVRKLNKVIPVVKEVLSFIKRDKAAKIIQTHFRMAIIRKRYASIRKAVIGLQSYARRFLVLENINLKAISVIRIQAYFRMYVARKRFLKLKAGVTLIEEMYLARTLMRIEFHKFRKLKSATLLIQEKFKAKQMMMRDKHTYTRLKCTTILIQRKFRANKLMKVTRSHYLNLKTAAIFVQRTFRANKKMRLQMNKYQELKVNTIFIQQKFRTKRQMVLERNNYQRLKHTTLVIQARFRANLLMRRQRAEYQRLQAATKFIQAKYRANVTMKNQKAYYLKLKKSAIVIQSHFRAKRMMKIQRIYFQSVKMAVIIIQQRYLAKKAGEMVRRNYLALKAAVKIIKERFLAYKLMKKYRQIYLNTKKSVRIIEERYLAKKLANEDTQRFQTLKRVVIVIQRKFRAKRRMRLERQMYLTLKKTAIIVQRRFKANKLCKIQRIKYLQQKKAAELIQARYLAYKAMQMERNRYLKLRKSVIIVQQRFRANKLTQLARSDYLSLKVAVKVIEMKYKAKILAQVEFEKYKVLKQAVIVIQKRFRANLAMKKQREFYLSYRKNVVLLQTRFKANKLAKIEKLKYAETKKAVLTIQQNYRARQLMKYQRNYFIELKKATIIIQRRFRAIKCGRKERVKYLNLKKAVRIIESRYQAKVLVQKQFNSFNELKRSVVFIQIKYRAYYLMKREREMFLKFKQAAVIIQKRFRATKMMEIVRRDYETLRKCTICIQRRYRANNLMKFEYNRFEAIRNATLIIQRRFRAVKLMKNEQLNYQQLRNVTIDVQRRYRARKLAKLERTKYLNLKMAVITIEDRYIANKLMKKEQNRYKNLKRAVLFVQSHYRNLLVTRKIRCNYLNLKSSAEFIQRRFTANKAAQQQRQKYITLKNSVILIQRTWRAKRLLKNLKTNVIIIQAFVRGFLTRQKFNQTLRPILVEKKRIVQIERNAAVKIQAYWRGYRTRSVEKPEITRIRTKVKIAHKNAEPEKTLAYKKQKALDTMINENSTLEQIIAALRDLDNETRLFKESCFKLSQCLPQELYKMIITSSRSLPEMHACTAATGILINFCKHPLTIGNCWLPEYLSNILTVMIHWCDKEYPLFLYLCTLIWILARDKHRKRTIKHIPNVSQKLSKMKQLCDRKHKMILKVPSRGNEMFSSYRNVPLPSLEPDWGLEYSHKPRTFKNSVHAMHCVLDILDLHS